MIPILNPGRKARRRKAKRKSRCYSGSTLYRSRRGAFRRGLIAGGKKCGLAFRALRSGRKSASGLSLKPGSLSLNPRRRKARNYYTPGYSFNPSALVGGAVSSVKSAFRPSKWMSVVPIAGGLVANGIVSNFAAGMLPISQIQSGYGKAAFQAATAGITRMITGYIPGLSKYSNDILTGGVLGALVTGLTTFGQKNPFLSGMGCGCNVMGAGLAGVGDWLDAQQVAAPIQAPVMDPHVPLGNRNINGMGNFTNQPDYPFNGGGGKNADSDGEF